MYLMLHLVVHIFKKGVALILLSILAAAPAFAQINYESKGHHKQLRKQFVKEANTVEVQYKDTHLDISSYNFKKGEPGRSRVWSDKYDYTEGTAPDKKKRFLFKRKPKSQKKNN
jgi:hypothetical protein